VEIENFPVSKEKHTKIKMKKDNVFADAYEIQQFFKCIEVGSKKHIHRLEKILRTHPSA
jgi:hypothetical protein